MIKKVRFIIVLGILVLAGQAKAANVCVTTNKAWSAAGIGIADNVTIANGATLTIDVANAQCASITLGSPLLGCTLFASQGTLAFNAAAHITVNGLVTLGGSAAAAAAGNLNMTNGYLTCQGFLVVKQGVYTSGGTVELTATNILPTAIVSTMNIFNNVIINGGTTTLGQATTINGNLTISSGVLDVSASLYQITILGNWTNNSSNAAVVPRTGTIKFNGNTIVGGAFSTNFYNITINAGKTLSGSAGTAFIRIQKNWVNNGTFTHGGGTVEFYGTTSMTGSVTTTSFNNLTIFAGGTLTAGNAAGATINVAGDWTNNGAFTHNNSNVTFNGTGPQLLAGTNNPNFYKLTINATGTVTQTTASVNVINLLTMTSGTFDVQANTLNGVGGLTATGGNLEMAKLTTLPELTGVYSITGGTCTFYGNGAQVIKSKTYFNVVINGASGTKTLAGVVTIAGDLTIATANTLDVTALNYGITLAGNWSNSGVFTARNGTVTFNGATTVSGTSTTSFYAIIINTGNSLTGHAAAINVANNFTNNGTYTHNNGLVTFNGTSTILGTQVTSFYDLTVNAANTLTSYAGNVNIADILQNDGTFTHNAGTITFNGANGSVRGATITTFNNITISAATTLTGHPTNFNVLGNFTNNNIYNANGAKITFNGAAAQAIGGTTASTTFHNVDINKATGTLTLNQNINIDNTGILNLMAGPVAINKKTITVNNGTSGAIARTTGYLISEDNSTTAGKANNSSNVIWVVGNNTGIHLYPFATAGGAYMPFTYNLIVGNAGNVTVATYHATTSAPKAPLPATVTAMYDTTYSSTDNSLYAVNRFWSISSAGGTASLTFGYDDPTDIASLTGGETGSDGKGLRAQQWDGTNTWLRLYNPSQTHNAVANTVLIPGYSGALSGARPWTLALHVSPLPIELLNFKVSLNKLKEAEINWQTAQEVNNKTFIVERSANGVLFSSITEQNGSGNSSSLKSYSLVDKAPFKGVSYYRLKQVDFDGSFTYSPIVPLTNQLSTIESYKLMPNPIQSTASLVLKSAESGMVKLNVYDQLGRLVLEQKMDVIEGDNSFVVDATTLSPGIYSFTMINQSNTSSAVKGTFVKN